MTMIRPLNKRAPEIADDKLLVRYAKMSKADWADMYFDLYRAACGEDASDEEIIQDAEKRLDILKSYRKTQRA